MLRTVGWDGVPTRLTHFPPGYPIALAASRGSGSSPETFARWLNVALFAALIGLTARLTRDVAPVSAWGAAAAAAWLCALAPDLVAAHSMVWSEPLYLTLTALGLLALSAALARGSGPWLALAGGLAAASAVVRYVGVANIVVPVAATLLWWPASRMRRFAVAAALGALTVLPWLAVMVASAAGDGGAVANRKFVWHPIMLADVEVATAVVGKWITPLSDANVVSVVWLGVLGALGAVVLFARSRAWSAGAASLNAGRAANAMTGRVVLLYAAAYAGVLLLSVSFVDAQTVPESRLLTPLQVVAMVLGAAWLVRRAARGGLVRRAAVALFALVLAAEVLRLAPWLSEARAEGLGLRRQRREAAELVHAARRLPPEARVYSNDPYFLRVQTNRVVAGLPRRRDPTSLLPNERLEQQLRAICDSAFSRPTFLVVFSDPESGDSSADPGSAGQSAEVTRLPGGALMRVRPGCSEASEHSKPAALLRLP